MDSCVRGRRGLRRGLGCHVPESRARNARGMGKRLDACRTTLFRDADAPAPIVACARGLALDMSANDHELVSLHAGREKFLLDMTGGNFELYDLARETNTKLERCMRELGYLE